MEVTIPPLDGVTDAGEKLHVEFTGCPEHVSVTAELKPLRPPTVTVMEPVCPALIVKAAGDALILKSAVGAGVVFAVIAAKSPCCSLAKPAVMYMVLASPEGPPPPKTMSHNEAFVMTVPF
jgi:hypothetical protein